MADVSSSPGFEGPEKVLEIDMTPGPDFGPERGLREITRATLDIMCTAANCTILSTMSSSVCDSYVLSESSLFVYSHKMIMKTCGTTTLLKALPPFFEATKALGMSIEWMSYTRKDFFFPQAQKFPHRDPNEEITYLKELFPEGDAFILGPMTGDHWFVFVADYVDRPTSDCVDRTLDMMMFGLDESAAKLFFQNKDKYPEMTDVTKAAKIDTLLPGSDIQEHCFDPCGYSMNGLIHQAYWTIHITPESHCSYASFETNVRMKDYSRLVRAVLAIFRPKRFTMTLFTDEHGLKQITTPFLKLISSAPIALEGADGAACVVDDDGNTGYSAKADGGVGAGAPPSPTASRRVKYLQSNECSQEFLGVSCHMANYTAFDGDDTATPVPPRARFIVSERLAEMTRRGVSPGFGPTDSPTVPSFPGL